MVGSSLRASGQPNEMSRTRKVRVVVCRFSATSVSAQRPVFFLQPPPGGLQGSDCGADTTRYFSVRIARLEVKYLARLSNRTRAASGAMNQKNILPYDGLAYLIDDTQ